MNQKKVYINIFVVLYALLVLLYFLGNYFHNDFIFLCVCGLSIIFILFNLNTFNNFLKSRNSSLNTRILLVVVIPVLILLFFIYAF
ncbi:hypothetical protein Clocel_0739 [Clostridium cellulovorans 743B]|uniref:Uncharacterized protein n=1 Tax=Clostridium cellulovorans (strain ATCC 35296 / DSM 3052 / OCM 3 / 743B) TaxID=573061 RepID=D9SRZ3_CLOC7|nr:hypothetical protein Clocel_0739 [Clostridium cellulovorans 743B]